MTTQEFIKRALEGTTKKIWCSSVMASTRLDGRTTVYSYGTHYPLVSVVNGNAFVNVRGYSNTTAKHINWALNAAHELYGGAYTFPIVLKYGESLTKDGITISAKHQMKLLSDIMASKKRKDTKVYAGLQYQYDQAKRALEAVSQ